MNFITKLFDKSLVECPRCLGKGHLDWEDIKRLKRELQWIPGQCAYCEGRGKVHAGVVANVQADSMYLTTELSSAERKRFIDGDTGALQRAANYESRLNNFIEQIIYLHFVGNLEAKRIFDFYMIVEAGTNRSSKERTELMKYIERVIEKSGRN